MKWLNKKKLNLHFQKMEWLFYFDAFKFVRLVFSFEEGKMDYIISL